MLSTVSVTSGRIFSAAESKQTSLIGINIFNNGLQFIIGEEETFRAIIFQKRFKVLHAAREGDYARAVA